MHGLSKAGLFLCAGIIEQRTHIKDITKLGGLIKTMPLTAGAFLFCAFSVMGIPPFGGFFCKYFVFAGGIQNGQIAITLVFVAGALITIVYLTRLFSMIFLGELKINASEKPGLMVISVVLFAVLSLVASLFMNYISYIARQAVLLSKVM
jgi:formate hydrogenlyase subunit 3/multisubunit Na+/H+ antiporter MnhD subunit